MHTMALFKKLSLVAVAVLGAGLLLGMTATRSQLNVTDLFNPLGLPNPMGVPPVGQLLNPPQVICPGQTPTGNPMLPCPEGSRIIERQLRLIARIESDSPDARGWLTLEHNSNYASDYTGPAWGKFSVQLDAGGSWEGTWNGIRQKTGASLWVADLRVVGHGLGGNVDGMQLKCNEIITAVTPIPIVYKGVATCRVLDPEDE